MCPNVFLIILVFVCVAVKYLISTTECNGSMPEDCSDIKLAKPSATTGIYTIKLKQGPCDGVNGTDVNGVCCVEVFCDMDRWGGGWTVFQKRYNGQLNFYRKWAEYEIGFGILSGEFYAGNKFLHYFTGRKNYELLVELDQGVDKCSFYASYALFRISSSKNKYRLEIGPYINGTAGDSLSHHNGKPFTTFDQDNDLHTSVNCAAEYKGAWWYYACHHSNLNGQYAAGCTSSFAKHMVWYASRGFYYSFKGTEMKLRPVDYKLHNPNDDNHLCPDDTYYTPCANDCHWNTWSLWTPCSNNQMSRRRTKNPRTTDWWADCKGKAIEMKSCGTLTTAPSSTWLLF